MLNDWNHRWITDPQYKHTKYFFPQVDPSKSMHTLKLSKAYLQIFTRAITGHNFLSKHQNRIGQPIAPECRLCEEDFETFIHLCNDCPVLRHRRQEIFLDKTPTNNGEWKAKDIMDFILSTDVYNMLLEKDNYNEQLIIDIVHPYSTDEDSDPGQVT